MLHSQDNLHSGPASPVSLTAADVTTLLPCNEEDFANGVEPKSRAALEDTPPAMENPSLITDPGRSLFAVLIQSHYLWGAVSRRVVSRDKSSRPWDRESEYAKMATRLTDWEKSLPHNSRWSNVRLKGYKAEGEELVCSLQSLFLINWVFVGSWLTVMDIGVLWRRHDHSSMQCRLTKGLPARVSCEKSFFPSCLKKEAPDLRLIQNHVSRLEQVGP